jgi:hypothetical protein
MVGEWRAQDEEKQEDGKRKKVLASSRNVTLQSSVPDTTRDMCSNSDSPVRVDCCRRGQAHGMLGIRLWEAPRLGALGISNKLVGVRLGPGLLLSFVWCAKKKWTG